MFNVHINYTEEQAVYYHLKVINKWGQKAYQQVFWQSQAED